MISELVIPYPDFKLNDMINPDEFDLNNDAVIVKVNAIRTVLNQITDSIVDGGSGADSISVTAIAPFVSVKLQSYLEEVIAKLRSTTVAGSGAEFVGSEAIVGVTGTNVSAQLKSLKTLLDNYITSNDTALANHKTSVVLDHPDASVVTAKIKDANVTTPKIADANVTTLKIADGNITTVKLADANVTLAKLAPNSVDATKIIDGSVGTNELADGGVSTVKIANGSITADKLASGLGSAGGVEIQAHNLDVYAHQGVLSEACTSYDAAVKIYTIVTYNRVDGSKFMVSTLSNKVGNNYTTSTVDVFALDGTTLKNRIVWSLAYDVDGNVSSKNVTSTTNF